MTKDPICGMTVDETTARQAERDGQMFYFCGEGHFFARQGAASVV